MKALHAPQWVAAASSAVALCWSLSASAQQSVVVQPSPPPAPAPAPAPATPPPAQPSPVVVTAAPAAPQVVEERPATVESDTGHDWRPNRALLMTGLILAGAPYIASISVAATSQHQGDSDLWVPVLGPWLDVGARGGCPNNQDCAAEIGNKVLLVGDGILQSVGVLEIAGAFIFPESRHVTTIRTSKNGDGFVSFAPARMGVGGYGLSAVGQF